MGSSECLDPRHPDSVWPYCPSFAGAVAFAAVFGISTIGHIAQGFYHKKPFTWVICVAASWETIGMALRSMGARDPLALSWAVSSNMLILLSPLWINAFVYMVGGRMVYFWLPERAVWKVKARFFTRIFVWADVATFWVQVVGGSMLSADDAKVAMTGQRIYMGGIGVQQGFLLLFLVLMIGFHVQARKNCTERETSWAPILYALYATLFFITVRIIFRLVEFTSGIYGVIPTNEYFIFVLEATPMSLALIIQNVFHPGRYMKGEGSEFAKPTIEKGRRRWWCCGRRRRVKVYQEDEEARGRSSGELLPVATTEYGQRYYQSVRSPSRSSDSDSVDMGEQQPRNHMLRENQAAP